MLGKNGFFIVLFYSLFLNAAAENSSTYLTQTHSTKLKKTKPASPWSFVLPAFVIHGARPSEEASESMPRKLDQAGDGVVTPGLGIKYEGSTGSLFVAGLVKDCYDNLAGALQYGFYSRLNQKTSWGLTAGLYIRETPITCEVSDYGYMQTTRCSSIDDLSNSFGFDIGGNLIDIIPMPFFHFSTELYKDRDLQINFKVMSNLLLNEFGIAVPF